MTSLLVLGGTQWLGRTVAGLAVERGIDVTCLARGEAGVVAEGVRHVRADRSRPDALDAVAGRDWDAVIDVSWQPLFVKRAVEALADRTGHWTYVSSASVYLRSDMPWSDESAELNEPLDAETADWDTYGPAKARCEQIVVEALGERALLARAGLIGGPGDPSDRFGYWVSRFCLAGAEPVLVPRAPDLHSQTIDVRDLATWILSAPGAGITGAVNAVGEALVLPEVLAEAAAVAGHAGSTISAEPEWLAAQGVEPWAGPRSLPLWLPTPEYAGFGARGDHRARSSGLIRRPLHDMLEDVLRDERERGLDRARRAGLDRPEELRLISLLS